MDCILLKGRLKKNKNNPSIMQPLDIHLLGHFTPTVCVQIQLCDFSLKINKKDKDLLLLMKMMLKFFHHITRRQCGLINNELR